MTIVILEREPHNLWWEYLKLGETVLPDDLIWRSGADITKMAKAEPEDRQYWVPYGRAGDRVAASTFIRKRSRSVLGIVEAGYSDLHRGDSLNYLWSFGWEEAYELAPISAHSDDPASGQEQLVETSLPNWRPVHKGIWLGPKATLRRRRKHRARNNDPTQELS